jgi:hypothetical protein
MRTDGADVRPNARLISIKCRIRAVSARVARGERSRARRGARNLWKFCKWLPHSSVLVSRPCAVASVDVYERGGLQSPGVSVCASGRGIVEVMPPQSRRIINSILRSAIREGLVEGDTCTVIGNLVDLPKHQRTLPRAARRLGRSHPRRPLRGGCEARPRVRNSAA